MSFREFLQESDIVKLIKEFNSLSSEIEHLYKTGTANSNEKSKQEFIEKNNKKDELLSKINSELKDVGYKDNELFKSNTYTINLNVFNRNYNRKKSN